MSHRFIELAVRARRLVTRAPGRSAGARPRPTARRQIGEELTQFSFRLALVIDLAYVGIGALGGAAVGRASAPTTNSIADKPPAAACTDSSASPRVPSAAAAPNDSALVTRNRRKCIAFRLGPEFQGEDDVRYQGHRRH
jgi:hypothetical protein